MRHELAQREERALDQAVGDERRQYGEDHADGERRPPSSMVARQEWLLPEIERLAQDSGGDKCARVEQATDRVGREAHAAIDQRDDQEIHDRCADDRLERMRADE